MTKKRGFDIASLVEDSECDTIPRKKNHPSSIGEQQLALNPASMSISSSFLPASHHLSNLSNNNNNNNDQHFPSAFKKVDKKGRNDASPLLDLSFNQGGTSSHSSNALDVSTTHQPSPTSHLPSPTTHLPSPTTHLPSPTSLVTSLVQPTPLPTTSNNGRPVTQSLLPFLPPSLAALTFPQTNWCAKCNATFRMTSDLVYHMRSHHKPSPSTDPIRKKREEKLRCNICGETFRERHHLTRHMTSHQ